MYTEPGERFSISLRSINDTERCELMEEQIRKRDYVKTYLYLKHRELVPNRS